METADNPKAARAALDGKAPLEFLEPALDAPLAHVMRHGAEKYGLRNYTVTSCRLRTYTGAALRHLHAIRSGEDTDPDSGQPHWAHVAACAAVVLAAHEAGTLVDDRKAEALVPASATDRAKVAMTPQYGRGIDELAEELAADAARGRWAQLSPHHVRDAAELAEEAEDARRAHVRERLLPAEEAR